MEQVFEICKENVVPLQRYCVFFFQHTFLIKFKTQMGDFAQHTIPYTIIIIL